MRLFRNQKVKGVKFREVIKKGIWLRIFFFL